MAVDTYTTLALLKESLNLDPDDTSKDARLTEKIQVASRQIDKTTGRRFYLDDAPTARTYRPARRVTTDRDGVLLLVDDIGDAAGLVVEMGTTGSWTPVTDFETSPDNALADGKAITGLLRLAWWFGGYGLRIRVTARWGWPAVPAEVGEATLLQAARLYRRKDSPEGVLGSAEWGVMRVSRADPDVQALLTDYVLPAIG